MGKYLFKHKKYMTREEIAELYYDVVADGYAETLFYDNGVFDEHSWMEFIDDGQWLVNVTYVDEKVEPAGMFWLNGFQGKTAQIHFCVRKAFEHKVDLGKAAVGFVKEHCELKSLYGCTPKLFRHVSKYIQDVGFNIKGELPGACYIEKYDRWAPGLISVMDLNNI